MSKEKKIEKLLKKKLRKNNLLKRIHIKQHKIKANKKNGTNDPVITVKTSKSNDYGHEVDINGKSKVVYRPNKPLSCGARVWIETREEVRIINTESREEKTLGYNSVGQNGQTGEGRV